MKISKPLLISSGVGFLLVLSGIFFYTFSQEKLSPSDVIMHFHDRAKAGQVEETKDYVSQDILKAFENGGFWHYGSYGNFIEEYQRKTDYIEPVEGTEKVSGETASVDVKTVYENGREETGTYYFVKEDGEWKIAE